MPANISDMNCSNNLHFCVHTSLFGIIHYLYLLPSGTYMYLYFNIWYGCILVFMFIKRTNTNTVSEPPQKPRISLAPKMHGLSLKEGGPLAVVCKVDSGKRGLNSSNKGSSQKKLVTFRIGSPKLLKLCVFGFVNPTF